MYSICFPNFSPYDSSGDWLSGCEGPYRIHRRETDNSVVLHLIRGHVFYNNQFDFYAAKTMIACGRS